MIFLTIYLSVVVILSLIEVIFRGTFELVLTYEDGSEKSFSPFIPIALWPIVLLIILIRAIFSKPNSNNNACKH